MKPVDPDELEETLQRYFKETRLNGSFLDKLKEEYQLTPRELEIVDLIGQGNTSDMIASQLCISKFTVNNHRQNILKKTACANFSELLSK